MGSVWRAVQLNTGREVALKLMRGNMSDDGRIRFEREVKLLARLEHTNIATVYASGIHVGGYYYAMELIDGVSLDQFVETRRLTQRLVLKLMCIVCKAVHHAHVHGVVHRDLKPGNIIVTPKGKPIIVDFGLALSERDGGARITNTGDIAGTPAYMAPEQAEGRVEDISPQTDVYALGAVLYRLVTSQPAHDLTGNRLQVLNRIANNEVRLPSSLSDDVDSDLEMLLLKALATAPEDRFDTADQMADALAHYISDRADESDQTVVSSSREHTIRRPTARVGMPVPMVIGLASLAALIFIGIVTALILGDPSSVVPSHSRPGTTPGNASHPDKPTPPVGTRNAGGFRFDSTILTSPAWTWTKPEPVPNVSRPRMIQTNPRLSADGLRMYFAAFQHKNRDAGFDLWVSHRPRRNDPFKPPVRVEGDSINTTYRESACTVSSDGLTLIFASDRPGGMGRSDLWMSRRKTVQDPWTRPVNMGRELNTAHDEVCPWISTDGRRLIFGSNQDLYISRRNSNDGAFPKPTKLGGAINTSGKELVGWMSPDQLILIVTARLRPNQKGKGNFDLWLFSRKSTNEPFGAAANLGGIVNSQKDDGCPTFSPDGKTMFFHSQRMGHSRIFRSRRVLREP